MNSQQSLTNEHMQWCSRKCMSTYPLRIPTWASCAKKHIGLSAVHLSHEMCCMNVLGFGGCWWAQCAIIGPWVPFRKHISGWTLKNTTLCAGGGCCFAYHETNEKPPYMPSPPARHLRKTFTTRKHIICILQVSMALARRMRALEGTHWEYIR